MAAPPCPPTINLELITDRFQDLVTSKYHVVFTVGAVVNIDANIFVFKQLLSRDPQSGLFDSVFEAIASLQALADFAVDVPNTGQVFFRKKVLELEFDSLVQAQDTEKLILVDINQLIADAKQYLAGWQAETVVEL